MAGIGFVLRKLYRQDNLSGLFSACLHSAFASTGPWLFTVIALGTISSFGQHLAAQDVLFNFRVILIYNFSFSLVIAGPIYMVATRLLADSIYRRDVSDAPSMLLGMLVLLWGISLVVAGGFYLLYARLPPALAVSAVVNFLLLAAVWLVGIFLSAIKNYQRITRAFFLGMVAAVAACLWLAEDYGTTGMLNGFSLGIALILSLLLGSILAEYPYALRAPLAAWRSFRKYWEIAASGLVYSMAVWVDKWIMWFAPESTKLANGLRIYPDYDSAMFIAYLTTVPAMAMFLFSTETHFFEHYRRFFRAIEEKATFTKISKYHQQVAKSIFGSAGHFLLLQGSIAVLGILMAPQLITALKGNYMQVGMLRYGMLGALFHVLTLFLLVLLSYFDNRRASVWIQAMFLGANALFTALSLLAGFRYYGYGYFIASFLTFVTAALVTTQYVARLPYHTFITTNASVT